MKKFLSVLLSAALCLTVFSFVGCGKTKKTLKLGLGIYTSVKTTDATDDKNGEGRATVTGAAILMDDQGKIVNCFVDCAEHKAVYTADGKAIANDSFATKYQQGDSYGMKIYGGAKKEWYEQADAFCSVVKGKTLDEIKALVASDHKGTDAVINAGCTIDISEFVLAVEKAVANAIPSDATEKDSLKLGVSTTQSTKDATEDANGQNQLETTFFASAVNAEKQIIAAKADCVQIRFTFDMNGISKFDSAKTILSKGEQGEAYGMKAYGGAKKEWYEQAEIFCASAIGKNAGDLQSLLGENGYASDDLQKSGCTIAVDGFIKAAVSK